MLPKIHKNREHPPGRPIVSGNGCPTERISKFVDFFLQMHIIIPSCHPRSCRRGIRYGQFLRLRLICSNEEDFIHQSKILTLHFHRANYLTELIRSSFERAFLQNREELLKPKPETNDANKDNLYLITTHHPTFREVNNIVSCYLDLLDRSKSTRPVIQANIVWGFRRCANLRDHLVRAKICTQK